LIILLAVTHLSGAQSAAEPKEPAAASREIADSYLVQARQAYREGRKGQAEALLEVALEFHPQSSESAYLYALILLAEQSSSHLAVPFLQRALSAGTWADTDPLEAVTQLAGFYTRTRRYGEARRLLESLGPSAAPASLGSRCTAALAAIWARVAAGQGQAAEAEAFLRRALERFPQSTDLYVLLARQLAARGRSTEAADTLRRASRALPGEAEPVLALAGLERSAAARLELADRYLAMGGRDPGAALLALRAGPKEPLRYFEEFLRLGGERQILYLDGLQELARQRAKEGAAWSAIATRLAASAARYSGWRVLDADADGLYEERYEYREGALRGWSLDEDQDGAAEVEASFAGGLPERITLYRHQTVPEAVVQLRYSAYPALADVTFGDRSSRRTYSLFPFQINAAAFASLPAGTDAQGTAGSARPLRLRYRGGLPDDENRVRRQSYSMAEYDAASGPEAQPLRRYHLLEGAVTRLEQAPDGRGGYRHVVHYDRSGPVEGRRDEDGDGRYEVREQYEAGALARILLDADGDGVEEFAQSVVGGVRRQSWDYDGDGRYDSVEYETAAGETVREFSSRLDGVYDLRAVFRGGRIVRFQRAGRALPVSYDERRRLYWIGRPLADSIPLEGPDGVQRRGGRSVFVLRYMGNLYVGEME